LTALSVVVSSSAREQVKASVTTTRSTTWVRVVLTGLPTTPLFLFFESQHRPGRRRRRMRTRLFDTIYPFLFRWGWWLAVYLKPIVALIKRKMKFSRTEDSNRTLLGRVSERERRIDSAKRVARLCCLINSYFGNAIVSI